MGSGEGHAERRVGIFSDKSRKSDYIVLKAVVIRIQIMSFTDDKPGQTEVISSRMSLSVLVYSYKDMKTDYIVQKAAVIKIQSTRSTNDMPGKAKVTTWSSKLPLECQTVPACFQGYLHMF
jgi:hypothetical protein